MQFALADRTRRRPDALGRRLETGTTVARPITDAECSMSALTLLAQPVDATQALNLSAGVSNCKVSRGRSFS
jgi:hypothetical protein